MLDDENLNVMEMLHKQVALESDAGQAMQGLVQMMINMGFFNLYSDEPVYLEDQHGDIAKYIMDHAPLKDPHVC